MQRLVDLEVAAADLDEVRPRAGGASFRRRPFLLKVTGRVARAGADALELRPDDPGGFRAVAERAGAVCRPGAAQADAGAAAGAGDAAERGVVLEPALSGADPTGFFDGRRIYERGGFARAEPLLFDGARVSAANIARALPAGLRVAAMVRLRPGAPPEAARVMALP